MDRARAGRGSEVEEGARAADVDVRTRGVAGCVGGGGGPVLLGPVVLGEPVVVPALESAGSSESSESSESGSRPDLDRPGSTASAVSSVVVSSGSANRAARLRSAPLGGARSTPRRPRARRPHWGLSSLGDSTSTAARGSGSATASGSAVAGVASDSLGVQSLQINGPGGLRLGGGRGGSLDVEQRSDARQVHVRRRGRGRRAAGIGDVRRCGRRTAASSLVVG